MLLCRHGSQDGLACKEVLDQNEYRLPDAFAAGDTIVDVGAHIGAFTVACIERGAERVEAYEPIADNIELYRLNMRRLGIPEQNARLHPNAVWHQQGTIFLKSMGAPYTAMFSAALPEGDLSCQAVTLNDVLAPLEKVRLLKLDCEGAEVPILESVSRQQMDKVEEVVGELHYLLHVPGFVWATNEWAKGVLAVLGFGEVVVRRNPRSQLAIGMFWGKRK